MSPNLTIHTMAAEETGCESHILMLIMKIQPIFLLIFGFLANLCSFVVLIQKRLRRRPTFSYLAFLSLSNAFLSLIHAFFTISGVYFGWTLENLSLLLFCRLINRFAIDFLSHFSLCTLTAVDLERVRDVTSRKTDQQRYNRHQSFYRQRIPTGFLNVCLLEFTFAGVLLFFNLHWLTSYGYTRVENYGNESMISKTMCTISGMESSSEIYTIYLSLILPIIELIFFGIVPFSTSLIATIIILRHLSIKYTSATKQNRYVKQSRRRAELHLSILLISLNCVYIICTTPHNIFNIYVTRLHRQLVYKTGSEGELCSVAFTQKSLDLLQQCYFMSTFFLYILTNHRFREEFYRLFQCCTFLRKLFPERDSTEHSSLRSTRTHHQETLTPEDSKHTHHYLLTTPGGFLTTASSISDMSHGVAPTHF